MPEKGICAHRGANQTHPENTIAAFEEAVRLGAHMIEFDVRMTKDKKLVIMHDKSVDRTTNGTGLVSELTLEDIEKLDAGSWKSKIFINEKVPTLKETLQMMPKNIWLNIHLKGDEELGEATAKVLVSEGRVHQGVIACGYNAAKGVKKVNSNIFICNMERQANRKEYVQETIQGGFSFIQLLNKREDNTIADDVKKLSKSHIMVNYYHAETDEEIANLFDAGVNFILTNYLEQALNMANSLEIKRVNYKTD
ncbi:MAG: glycerophosphodiester phosphodiesterase [Bacteroidetes bacterium]|nr:MAG: glycerophosphodiester phosphodiesterase [Bacteroidota bacterium]RLD84072.1 MAG: glycerophosphodiester phosphodiesterase [Bacteroidota bacterium]